MMQSKTAFPAEEAHLIVEELQPTQIQRHLTHITSLVEEHQNRILLTSSLPSGGQSESMSESYNHHHSQWRLCDWSTLIT